MMSIFFKVNKNYFRLIFSYSVNLPKKGMIGALQSAVSISQFAKAEAGVRLMRARGLALD